MKKYTYCFFMIGIIAALLTVLSSAAFAEGSVDLTEKGGYRPYLEWRDRSMFGLQRKNVVYVYAKQGEMIRFGTSVDEASNEAIRSIVADNGNFEIPGDLQGSSVAVTVPKNENGMPYDPTGAGNPQFKSIDNIGAATAGDEGIYLMKPYYMVVPAKTKGLINSRSKEKNGWSTKSAIDWDHYYPAFFKAPVTGTYAFRFLSSGYGEDNPDPKEADENWGNEGDGCVAAWDVTVDPNDDGNSIEGRVWMDVMFLNSGDNDLPINSKVYTLTEDGFEYEVDLNGICPFGFALYSNNRGLLLDRYNMAQSDGNRPHDDNGNEVPKNFDYLQSLMHSAYSYSSNDDVGPAPVRTENDNYGNPITDSTGKEIKSTVLNNFTPVDENRDKTHKIFLNKPSEDAIKAYTDNGKLTESEDEIRHPSVSGIEYEGLGYAAKVDENGVSYGTISIGGTFNIEASDFDNTTTKMYRIVLDFSGYELNEKNKPVFENGEWKKTNNPDDAEKNNIVVLTKVLLENGNHEITWDGQDAYGNNVPVGVYDNVGKSYWVAGMAHFPLVDVEKNPNGIKITRMNNISSGDSSNGRAMVFYNNESDVNKNSNLKWYYSGVQDNNYPIIGDGSNKLSGVDSSSGAMVYNNENNGNYTVLDIWSRYVVEDKAEISIGVSQVDRINPATVSFVAEEGVTNYSDLGESHIRSVDGNTDIGTGNKGLNDTYGNTISTGFMATIATEQLGNYGYNYINWEITIPITEETYVYTGSSGQTVEATVEPSYIKIPNSSGVNPEYEEILVKIASIFGDEALNEDVGLGADESFEDLGDDPYYAQDEFDSGLTAMSAEDVDGNTVYAGTKDLALSVDREPVLKDSDTVITNKGAIYKITGIADNDGTATYTKLKLKLSYELPLITGGTSVTYGLVIDNLYAPSAVAEASYSIDKPAETEYEALDGSKGDIEAGDLQKFEIHENNDYSKLQ